MKFQDQVLRAHKTNEAKLSRLVFRLRNEITAYRRTLGAYKLPWWRFSARRLRRWVLRNVEKQHG